jgi:hypothetical protein
MKEIGTVGSVTEYLSVSLEQVQRGAVIGGRLCTTSGGIR